MATGALPPLDGGRPGWGRTLRPAIGRRQRRGRITPTQPSPIEGEGLLRGGGPLCFPAEVRDYVFAEQPVGVEDLLVGRGADGT